MGKSIPKTIDYIEIPSNDVACSRAFFTALLGWTFTDYGPDYTAFEDGRIAGGFFKSENISLTDRGAALPVVYAEARSRPEPRRFDWARKSPATY
jgi:predicted enzyme related to lactoylglutathione lyase